MLTMISMEKQAGKAKNKLLRILPKAAYSAAVSFQNPFSPGGSREKRADFHANNKLRSTPVGIGLSGPTMSIIPAESRRTASSKNSSFEAQEPTSPKVSCIGQIKHKKMMAHKKKHLSSQPEGSIKPFSSRSLAASDVKHKLKPVASPLDEAVNKKRPSIRSIFSGTAKPTGRKSDASADDHISAPAGLSQMKKFASGRDTLAAFDWTKVQIAPHDSGDRNYDSDESDGIDGEEKTVIIPFSAPILMGAGRVGKDQAGLNLEPRKEINLWKRRTMAQPPPLQLNTAVRSK